MDIRTERATQPFELTDAELDHVVGGSFGGPKGGGPGNSGPGDKHSPVEGPPNKGPGNS
jgi:hypothetical protein